MVRPRGGEDGVDPKMAPSARGGGGGAAGSGGGGKPKGGAAGGAGTGKPSGDAASGSGWQYQGGSRRGRDKKRSFTFCQGCGAWTYDDRLQGKFKGRCVCGKQLVPPADLAAGSPFPPGTIQVAGLPGGLACKEEGQAEFLRKLLASDLGPGARTHFPELAALDEKPVVVVEVEPTTDEAVYQCQLATERRLVKEKDARKQTAEQVRIQGMLDKQRERVKASAVALLAATEECERYLALVHKAAPKPQVRATKEDPFKLDLSLDDFEIDTEGVPETFKEQLIVAKAKANELFAEHQQRAVAARAQWEQVNGSMLEIRTHFDSFKFSLQHSRTEAEEQERIKRRRGVDGAAAAVVEVPGFDETAGEEDDEMGEQPPGAPLSTATAKMAAAQEILAAALAAAKAEGNAKQAKAAANPPAAAVATGSLPG